MKSRMKILHLIATNFFGGPEKQILEHGQKLRQESRFDFCLVSFVEDGRANDLLDRAEHLGLPTRRLYTANSFNPKVIRDLMRILRVETCDLLVTHGYKANVIGRLATWMSRLPHVSVSRGWTAENRKIRLYERLDRMALRMVEHVVAVSEGQRQKLLAIGIDHAKVRVIRNAVKLKSECHSEKCGSLRAALGIGEDTLLVVGAGRLSPEKNFSGFIETSRHVFEQEPRAAFAIFGEGVLRGELERQVQALGLASRIFLPGFSRDFAALISQADVFYQSSFTEGLPNVVLEAFAARVPVVATDVGGTSEVVQDGRSGFLVHPEDPRATAERILLLLRDPQRRDRMGKAGHDFVGEELNFHRQTELYLKLYEEVLEVGKPRAEEIAARV